MIDKPRIGYAALNEKARLHAPARYLPIVVVPGNLGSRLTDPATDKLIWNPLGLPLGDGPGAFASDLDRLTQVTAELVPDDSHPFDDEDPRSKTVQGIKNYYHVVGEFYGELAQQMATLGTSDTAGAFSKIKARVYCAGYDWRQDNAKAAMRLAEVVEDALRETGERRVILIAHSMGGLVCRYYCRVLGGESKVHRLFLVGSPTLGAPLAYTQLKHGVPGFYVKDMVQDAQDHDGAALLGEGIQQGADVEQAAVGLGHDLMTKEPDTIKGLTETKKTALGLFGDIYTLLSLGAGRLLSRKETTYFARQFPSSYQLLPNAIFCRDHRNWILFDPAATGHVPTGLMIILPTLFELLTELLGASFKSFFQPENAERTSPRATRNAETLMQRLEKIGLALADKNPPVAPGLPPRTPAEEFMLLNANESAAFRMMGELIQRIQQSFVDCRSNRQLYSDIYTGFLDVVELRALSAANLAVALRLDEALTVNPRPEKGVSLLDPLMAKFLLPVLASGPDAGPLGLGKLVAGKLLADKRKDDARPKAKTYMHPRTVNIYCGTEAQDTGALLVPMNILSNDDSNIVRWALVPMAMVMLPLRMAAGASSTSGLAAQSFGDGTVPAISANPDPEVLSSPFLQSVPVSNLGHTDLTADKLVISIIKSALELTVDSFLET